MVVRTLRSIVPAAVFDANGSPLGRSNDNGDGHRRVMEAGMTSSFGCDGCDTVGVAHVVTRSVENPLLKEMRF